ncbi:SGNH/GDSL hydrolase family protein [Pseudomonas corrugata]|uniref:SGNH/GDSL hydrolase family protein n=1 Tax=Pseudomonas corrugata TaxID=47879 RepID=UPI0028C42582|nr:SGNH/GDSL hydrolase family protein [Pseudomonas corrugata]MDU9039993.1 SGNH/GDSL hydrolase family protein [Pseudomonas corrugata]
MSVQPGPTEKRYAANGVTTIYAVPFLVIEAGDLKVYLNGVLQTSGYTQTGVGNPTSSITFTVAPLGDLYLVLEVPFQRLVDYQENGDFLSSTVNRDFDRIWQALKQLLTTTGRSPVLGVNDVDGAGFYRAKGNGLIDLASAAGSPTAATNLQDVLDYVGSVLETGQGPINNAANVVYVYPDSIARNVQSLATQNNPLLGSAGIGHNAGTVRDALLQDALDIDALEGLAATAALDISKLKIGPTKSHTSANGFLISQNPWSVRCLNILGDSISAGANAQNIERDSWVGIFKKMLNLEFGTGNIGFLNIIPTSSNAEGVYQQYFSSAASQTGTWTSLTNASAAHIPSGYALQSSVAGSTQNLKCPLSQRYMRVWYDGTVTGEIEVVINSVVVQTIATTGTGTGYDRGPALELGTLVASNQGVCLFTLRCKSGTIRLTGLEFTNENSGGSFRVHNFSRDGRSGRYVAQSVINTACAGTYAMVWALGTNDITGYDETALAEYTQRIDWIIAAAQANRAKIVFIDFLFNQAYDHPLRQQLRRGAAAIPNALLIDVEQLWTISGGQFTEAERIARGLSVGVHPEEVGHRLVAEALAQRLGLSVTSKRAAVLRDPIWKALDISASAFANNSTIPGRISAYRVGERCVEIIVNLSTVPAVLTTLGTISIADFTGFAGANFKSNPDPTGKNGLFTVTSSGDVVYRPDPTITGTPQSCSLYANIPYHDANLWP